MVQGKLHSTGGMRTFRCVACCVNTEPFIHAVFLLNLEIYLSFSVNRKSPYVAFLFFQ